MGGLGSVHETGRDAQALQRCDCLPANKTALADTTDNHLSSFCLRLGDAFDRSKEPLSGMWICLVQSGDMRQGSCFNGQNSSSTVENGH